MNLPCREKHALGNILNVTPREFDNHCVAVILAFMLLTAFESTTGKNYLFSKLKFYLKTAKLGPFCYVAAFFESRVDF